MKMVAQRMIPTVFTGVSNELADAQRFWPVDLVQKRLVLSNEKTAT